ncbi:MAG: LysR family transcriptional regulator [Betaproteobacteria bacterium]|nr:LysR family transcriptional regulator [Betaproteobacteria bacterium]
MTLTQLRHFIGLAKAGSFVKASSQMFLTQPALSRSIKSLEDELGQLLFDRSGKKIDLTPFGRSTLQRCQDLMEEVEALKQAGKALERTDKGHVRLGLSSGPGAILTAPIMRHFSKYFPQFHVEILRANTEALTHMLRERNVDAMVVDIRSMRPAADLHVTEIGEMKGAFMCRKHHPLAKLSKVSFKQLRQYPVASTPLSDELARVLIERYGESGHPNVLVNYSSDEISQLVHVAELTDTLLLAIRDSAPHLVEVQLVPQLNDHAKFGLVTLANKAEALYLNEIRKLMRESFN